VAINPATPVELLCDILCDLDYVLLMSVNPGFSGQRFLPRSLDKARRLHGMMADLGCQPELALDGGVDLTNIQQAASAGIDWCVAGTSVFAAAEPTAAISKLRTRAQTSP
jgi:ribulose-phosphate 3-epimerase